MFFPAHSVAASAVLTAFRAVTPALESLPIEVAEYDVLGDDVLLDVQREIAAQNRQLGARAAIVAGQIARRSAPELGSAGLAQRTGFRTPEELVRVATGSTAGDAKTAVRVGVIMAETAQNGRVDQSTGELLPPARPWLAGAARAVASGALSIVAVESIRNGLGEPTDTVTPAMLAVAAARLVREAATVDADRLFARARELRDELDAEGIADREQERREARSLRVFKRANGMGRLVWDMDPETFQIVAETYDQLTSPRRGGPRFVTRDGSAEEERSERILADVRTTDQLASDGFLNVLRIGGDVAPTAVIGLRRPSVRVLVTERALRERQGHGRLEGHRDPVSIETVERIACTDGTVPVTFNPDGQPLDVGREQRLYTRRQRIALAARDGGCRWPGCERPPAWTEAHHTKYWKRDEGNTDVADGVLLCRHHHLLTHNNHWEIMHDHGDYWLIPPPDIDRAQLRIPMPTHSPAMRDLALVAVVANC